MNTASNISFNMRRPKFAINEQQKLAQFIIAISEAVISGSKTLGTVNKKTRRASEANLFVNYLPFFFESFRGDQPLWF